jgi:selenide,water dikinase
MAEAEPRLTSLAHGGGCGCKLGPSVLRDLLVSLPQTGPFANLLVGTETGDDAAIYRLNDSQALVATTDFFTPVVDDPFDFGRIAAANALSDVYAMGGTPIMALALLGMPVGKISIGTTQRILAGGAAICAQAGIPVAGGHSIDSPEPLYGLVALGLVHPDRILRNSAARPGDVLILTKGLGIGIFSAALKQGRLAAADAETMIASATQLNAIGHDLAQLDGVHAMTDVTGFGLLGHALEICRGSRLSATLHAASLPILPGARALAEQGIATGAGARNWSACADEVRLDPSLPSWLATLLCDPQTSGGLLIAAAASSARDILARLASAGFAAASVIGGIDGPRAGLAGVWVI